MDKDKNSTNQNLKHPLIQTYEMLWRHKTQTRIQLSHVQVPVQEMPEIRTFHQQVPHKTTEHKCATIEEVNAVLAFTKSPHSVQATLR